jgi:hypothetical protein
VARALTAALPEARTVDAPGEDFTPWDVAYLDLDRRLGSGSGVLPYLWHRQTTPELVAELFEAAAEFRALRPWQLLDDDNPVRVVSSRGEWRPLLVSVMGSAGIARGIAVFDAEADFARVMADRGFSGVVYVSFEVLSKVSHVVRAQAEQYGWKIANRASFPSLFRVRHGLPVPFLPEDLIRATAAFRGVSEVAREIRASRRAGRGKG